MVNMTRVTDAENQGEGEEVIEKRLQSVGQWWKYASLWASGGSEKKKLIARVVLVSRCGADFSSRVPREE